MKIKNLIFDLDGTLWDSRFAIIENWNQVLKPYLNRSLRVEDMNPYMGLLADDVLRTILPGISEKEIGEILNQIIENEHKILRKVGGILYDGVEVTLKNLTQTHQLYIVSNCQVGYIEAFLDFYGFKNWFQDFESHGATGQNKAHNIGLVVERNRLNPEETLYVGDTQTDYESAKANQLKMIFCEYGFGNLNSDSDAVRIKEFSEIPRVVSRI